MIEVLLRTSTGRILVPRLARVELAAPELLDAEVASVLRKLAFRGTIELTRVMGAIEQLAAWPIERVRHSRILRSSVRWWNNATAYDALYLAVASQYRGTVLTVDGPLARAPITDVLVENVHLSG